MVVYNPVKREIDIKIVYYGPALCGKTTNVQWIHRVMNPKQKGELVSLATKDDRTLFFDFLPIELDSIKGFKTRFHIYTVPGQVMYNLTRRAVLTGVDGVVFVADSQEGKMEENIESLNDLKENLGYYKKDLESIPFILQYNKRDLDALVSVEEMDEKLNALTVPSFSTSALNGEGVMETLTMCCKLVLKQIKDKTGATKESRAVSKEMLKEKEKKKIEEAITELPELKLVASNDQQEAIPFVKKPMRAEHVGQAVLTDETSDGIEGLAEQESRSFEKMTDTSLKEEEAAGSKVTDEELWLDEVQEIGGQDEPLKMDQEVALDTSIAEAEEVEGGSEATQGDSLGEETITQETLNKEEKRTCPRCFLQFKNTVKQCPICKISLVPGEREAKNEELEVKTESPEITEEVVEELSGVAEEELPEIPEIADVGGNEKGLEIVACGQTRKISPTAFKVPLIIKVDQNNQEFMVNLSINFEDFILKAKE